MHPLTMSSQIQLNMASLRKTTAITLVLSAYSVILLLLLVSSLVVNVICASAFPLNKKNKKSNFTLIKTLQELNSEGPYLGLITVYPPEEEAFLATKAFQPHPTHPFVDLTGRRFRVGKIHGKKVIFVKCGIGTINAAVSTQQMVDMFDVSGIIHFGIAGNANSSWSIGDVTIPKQFAHTGIWTWQNPNRTLNVTGISNVAYLDVGNFNVPKGEGINLLGQIGYSKEQFFSKSGQPNVPQNVFWLETSRRWLRLAADLEGMELERCLNSSSCLPDKPKVVVGFSASTANIFVDNAAYREYLFKTFGVSSVDMESVAVVMTSLSNSLPVIVFRGLSDLAGGQAGHNAIGVFGPLASLNVAKAVIRFIDILPKDISGF